MFMEGRGRTWENTTRGQGFLGGAGRGYMERGNRSPQEEVIPKPNEGIQIKIHHSAFCATQLICEVVVDVLGRAWKEKGDNEHKMNSYMNQEVVMEEIAQE
ncbi:hypothetical protein ACJX0J_011371, partial [Zea mays]